MKQMIILVPDGPHNLSSVIGCYKIFTRANEYWKNLGNKPVFNIQLAGTSRRVELYDGLFTVKPHVSIKEVKRAHLVIVPSLNHQYEEVAKRYKEMANWIRQQHDKGAEIASICTGAFLLAASGLLNGKSCSTHWSATDALRTMF